MNLDLAGRVVLVTGASAGIGRATAYAFLAEGAHVVVNARRADLLETIRAEADVTTGRLVTAPGDITRPADRDAIRDTVLREFGQLDVLVNNAGYSSAVAWDADDEVWRRAFELNFHAHRQLTHLFLADMLAREYGRIVNVTGTMEPLGLNASIAAKAALHAWAKGLSRDVAPHGITVNSVPPGRIGSEQIDQRLYQDPQVRARFIEEHIPAGRFGEAADVARLILFLASKHAGYITGQVVAVDGGMKRFSF